MAQAIVLFCDPHLVEDGERVEAEAIPWKGKVMDLCVTCQADYTIADLDVLVDKYGRKAVDEPTKPKGDRSHRAKKPEPGAPVHRCNFKGDDGKKCGRELASAQGLSMHQFRSHGMRTGRKPKKAARS